MPSDDSLHDLIREFHTEELEREYCLGKECPDHNCKICPAAGHAKFMLDVNDSDGYRQKVAGYYTSNIKRVVDEDGKEKIVYTRPG